MDRILYELAFEIEKYSSSYEARVFLDFVNVNKYRQGFQVLEHLKNSTELPAEVLKLIEEYWWNYAN